MTNSNKGLVKNEPQAITSYGPGISIEGLEGIPASDMPLPVMRFTGEKTEDKTLADGSECPNGVFLNSATKEYQKELRFRVLVVGKSPKPTFNDPNVMEDTYSLVGRNELGGDLFVMNIRSTSMYDFQKIALPQLAKAGREKGGIFAIVVVAKAASRVAQLKNGKSVKYEYAAFSVDLGAETTPKLIAELKDLRDNWKDYLIKNKGMEESETIKKAEESPKAEGTISAAQEEQISKSLDDLPA